MSLFKALLTGLTADKFETAMICVAIKHLMLELADIINAGHDSHGMRKEAADVFDVATEAMTNV
jgi:hypothetical protein